MTKLALATVILLALALSAACGGGGGDEALDLHRLAEEVQEATADIDSYRMRADIEFHPQEEGEASGDSSLPEESGKIKAKGEFAAPDRVRYSFTMSELSATGGVFPPLPRELLYDGKTVFVKLEETSEEWEEAAYLSAAVASINVAPSLWELVARLFALTDVEVLPSETVDGVRTIHLRGRLSQGLLDRPLRFESSGTAEFWVGERDHLIRRARYSLVERQVFPESLVRSGTVTIKRDVDVYFYDYNAPITIEAPDLK